MLKKSEVVSFMVWPAIVALPLTLTQTVIPQLHYSNVFPSEWYDFEPRSLESKNIGHYPSPLGLSLGIGAVVVGQFCMLMYFIYLARPTGQAKHIATITKTRAIKSNREDADPEGGVSSSAAFIAIQKEGARSYELKEGLLTHLAQPEGFVMLGGYLIGTWMLDLMPGSYYSFSGGINWYLVFLQLLLQDSVQYCMHMIEHVIRSTTKLPFNIPFLPREITWPFNLYAVSHKPHHRFTNPRLFDAFNGSAADTFLMILVPLFITAHIVHCNVWTYMAFGSLYANWLTLIHSEYKHPWEGLFKAIGFGTAADHHVHHKLFNYNYGHLFMYCDWVFGTYRDPAAVEVFNRGI